MKILNALESDLENYLKTTPPKFFTPIVSIYLTDNQEIHELNLKYRKKNKPTDVLSFLDGTYSLGEIIISLDKVTEQAKKLNISSLEEITKLLIHGTLHLIGFEHEKVSSKMAQRMRRKEKAIFKKI